MNLSFRWSWKGLWSMPTHSPVEDLHWAASIQYNRFNHFSGSSNVHAAASHMCTGVAGAPRRHEVTAIVGTCIYKWWNLQMHKLCLQQQWWQHSGLWKEVAILGDSCRTESRQLVRHFYSQSWSCDIFQTWALGQELLDLRQ